MEAGRARHTDGDRRVQAPHSPFCLEKGSCFSRAEDGQGAACEGQQGLVGWDGAASLPVALGQRGLVPVPHCLGSSLP